MAIITSLQKDLLRKDSRQTTSSTKDLQIHKYGFQDIYAVAFYCSASLRGNPINSTINIINFIMQYSFVFKWKKSWALNDFLSLRIGRQDAFKTRTYYVSLSLFISIHVVAHTAQTKPSFICQLNEGNKNTVETSSRE